MGRAEDLLNSVDNEPSSYLVDPVLETHIVIDENRIITVPNELKRIAVQYDHNIETVVFDCPRYWDGHDMSEMVVYINYECPNKTLGSYLADNVRIDDEDPNIMHFDWTISRNVTSYKGNLTFLVCVKKAGEDPETGEPIEINHWNSELNEEMYISEGLECTETFERTYPDLYTQLVELGTQAIDEVKYLRENIDDVNNSIKIAVAAAGSAAQSVLDIEMMIERVGGIQGPKGDKGDQGEQGESGVTVDPNGLFTLAVDPETGDLYAYYPEDSEVPEFEYDEETGNLYYVMEVEDNG